MLFRKILNLILMLQLSLPSLSFAQTSNSTTATTEEQRVRRGAENLCKNNHGEFHSVSGSDIVCKCTLLPSKLIKVGAPGDTCPKDASELQEQTEEEATQAAQHAEDSLKHLQEMQDQLLCATSPGPTTEGGYKCPQFLVDVLLEERNTERGDLLESTGEGWTDFNVNWSRLNPFSGEQLDWSGGLSDTSMKTLATSCIAIPPTDVMKGIPDSMYNTNKLPEELNPSAIGEKTEAAGFDNTFVGLFESSLQDPKFAGFTYKGPSIANACYDKLHQSPIPKNPQSPLYRASRPRFQAELVADYYYSKNRLNQGILAALQNMASLDKIAQVDCTEGSSNFGKAPAGKKILSDVSCEQYTDVPNAVEWCQKYKGEGSFAKTTGIGGESVGCSSEENFMNVIEDSLLSYESMRALDAQIEALESEMSTLGRARDLKDKANNTLLNTSQDGAVQGPSALDKGLSSINTVWNMAKDTDMDKDDQLIAKKRELEKLKGVYSRMAPWSGGEKFGKKMQEENNNCYKAVDPKNLSSVDTIKSYESHVGGALEWVGGLYYDARDDYKGNSTCEAKKMSHACLSLKAQVNETRENIHQQLANYRKAIDCVDNKSCGLGKQEFKDVINSAPDYREAETPERPARLDARKIIPRPSTQDPQKLAAYEEQVEAKQQEINAKIYADPPQITLTAAEKEAENKRTAALYLKSQMQAADCRKKFGKDLKEVNALQKELTIGVALTVATAGTGAIASSLQKAGAVGSLATKAERVAQVVAVAGRVEGTATRGYQVAKWLTRFEVFADLIDTSRDVAQAFVDCSDPANTMEPMTGPTLEGAGQSASTIPACPVGAGDGPSAGGYNGPQVQQSFRDCLFQNVAMSSLGAVGVLPPTVSKILEGKKLRAASRALGKDLNKLPESTRLMLANLAERNAPGGLASKTWEGFLSLKRKIFRQETPDANDLQNLAGEIDSLRSRGLNDDQIRSIYGEMSVGNPQLHAKITEHLNDALKLSDSRNSYRRVAALLEKPDFLADEANLALAKIDVDRALSDLDGKMTAAQKEGLKQAILGTPLERTSLMATDPQVRARLLRLEKMAGVSEADLLERAKVIAETRKALDSGSNPREMLADAYRGKRKIDPAMATELREKANSTFFGRRFLKKIDKEVTKEVEAVTEALEKASKNTKLPIDEGRYQKAMDRLIAQERYEEVGQLQNEMFKAQNARKASDALVSATETSSAAAALPSDSRTASAGTPPSSSDSVTELELPPDIDDITTPAGARPAADVRRVSAENIEASIPILNDELTALTTERSNITRQLNELDEKIRAVQAPSSSSRGAMTRERRVASKELMQERNRLDGQRRLLTEKINNLEAEDGLKKVVAHYEGGEALTEAARAELMSKVALAPNKKLSVEGVKKVKELDALGKKDFGRAKKYLEDNIKNPQKYAGKARPPEVTRALRAAEGEQRALLAGLEQSADAKGISSTKLKDLIKDIDDPEVRSIPTEELEDLYQKIETGSLDEKVYYDALEQNKKKIFAQIEEAVSSEQELDLGEIKNILHQRNPEDLGKLDAVLAKRTLSGTDQGTLKKAFQEMGVSPEELGAGKRAFEQSERFKGTAAEKAKKVIAYLQGGYEDVPYQWILEAKKNAGLIDKIKIFWWQMGAKKASAQAEEMLRKVLADPRNPKMVDLYNEKQINRAIRLADAETANKLKILKISTQNSMLKHFEARELLDRVRRGDRVDDLEMRVLKFATPERKEILQAHAARGPALSLAPERDPIPGSRTGVNFEEISKRQMAMSTKDRFEAVIKHYTGEAEGIHPEALKKAAEELRFWQIFRRYRWWRAEKDAKNMVGFVRSRMKQVIAHPEKYLHTEELYTMMDNASFIQAVRSGNINELKELYDMRLQAFQKVEALENYQNLERQLQLGLPINDAAVSDWAKKVRSSGNEDLSVKISKLLKKVPDGQKISTTPSLAKVFDYSKVSRPRILQSDLLGVTPAVSARDIKSLESISVPGAALVWKHDGQSIRAVAEERIYDMRGEVKAVQIKYKNAAGEDVLAMIDPQEIKNVDLLEADVPVVPDLVAELVAVKKGFSEAEKAALAKNAYAGPQELMDEVKRTHLSLNENEKLKVRMILDGADRSTVSEKFITVSKINVDMGEGKRGIELEIPSADGMEFKKVLVDENELLDRRAEFQIEITSSSGKIVPLKHFGVKSKESQAKSVLALAQTLEEAKSLSELGQLEKRVNDDFRLASEQKKTLLGKVEEEKNKMTTQNQQVFTAFNNLPGGKAPESVYEWRLLARAIEEKYPGLSTRSFSDLSPEEKNLYAALHEAKIKAAVDPLSPLPPPTSAEILLAGGTNAKDLLALHGEKIQQNIAEVRARFKIKEERELAAAIDANVAAVRDEINKMVAQQKRVDPKKLEELAILESAAVDAKVRLGIPLAQADQRIFSTKDNAGLFRIKDNAAVDTETVGPGKAPANVSDETTTPGIALPPSSSGRRFDPDTGVRLERGPLIDPSPGSTSFSRGTKGPHSTVDSSGTQFDKGDNGGSLALLAPPEVPKNRISKYFDDEGAAHLSTKSPLEKSTLDMNSLKEIQAKIDGATLPQEKLLHTEKLIDEQKMILKGNLERIKEIDDLLGQSDKLGQAEIDALQKEINDLRRSNLELRGRVLLAQNQLASLKTSLKMKNPAVTPLVAEEFNLSDELDNGLAQRELPQRRFIDKLKSAFDSKEEKALKIHQQEMQQFDFANRGAHVEVGFKLKDGKIISQNKKWQGLVKNSEGQVTHVRLYQDGRSMDFPLASIVGVRNIEMELPEITDIDRGLRKTTVIASLEGIAQTVGRERQSIPVKIRVLTRSGPLSLTGDLDLTADALGTGMLTIKQQVGTQLVVKTIPFDNIIDFSPSLKTSTTAVAQESTKILDQAEIQKLSRDVTKKSIVQEIEGTIQQKNTLVMLKSTDKDPEYGILKTFSPKTGLVGILHAETGALKYFMVDGLDDFKRVDPQEIPTSDLGKASKRFLEHVASGTHGTLDHFKVEISKEILTGLKKAHNTNSIEGSLVVKIGDKNLELSGKIMLSSVNPDSTTVTIQRTINGQKTVKVVPLKDIEEIKVKGTVARKNLDERYESGKLLSEKQKKGLIRQQMNSNIESEARAMLRSGESTPVKITMGSNDEVILIKAYNPERKILTVTSLDGKKKFEIKLDEIDDFNRVEKYKVPSTSAGADTNHFTQEVMDQVQSARKTASEAADPGVRLKESMVDEFILDERPDELLELMKKMDYEQETQAISEVEKEFLAASDDSTKAKIAHKLVAEKEELARLIQARKVEIRNIQNNPALSASERKGLIEEFRELRKKEDQLRVSTKEERKVIGDTRKAKFMDSVRQEAVTEVEEELAKVPRTDKDLASLVEEKTKARLEQFHKNTQIDQQVDQELVTTPIAQRRAVKAQRRFEAAKNDPGVRSAIRKWEESSGKKFSWDETKHKEALQKAHEKFLGVEVFEHSFAELSSKVDTLVEESIPPPIAKSLVRSGLAGSSTQKFDQVLVDAKSSLKAFASNPQIKVTAPTPKTFGNRVRDVWANLWAGEARKKHLELQQKFFKLDHTTLALDKPMRITAKIGQNNEMISVTGIFKGMIRDGRGDLTHLRLTYQGIDYDIPISAIDTFNRGNYDTVPSAIYHMQTKIEELDLFSQDINDIEKKLNLIGPKIENPQVMGVHTNDMFKEIKKLSKRREQIVEQFKEVEILQERIRKKEILLPDEIANEITNSPLGIKNLKEKLVSLQDRLKKIELLQEKMSKISDDPKIIFPQLLKAEEDMALAKYAIVEARNDKLPPLDTLEKWERESTLKVKELEEKFYQARIKKQMEVVAGHEEELKRLQKLTGESSSENAGIAKRIKEQRGILEESKLQLGIYLDKQSDQFRYQMAEELLELPADYTPEQKKTVLRAVKKAHELPALPPMGAKKMAAQRRQGLRQRKALIEQALVETDPKYKSLKITAPNKQTKAYREALDKILRGEPAPDPMPNSWKKAQDYVRQKRASFDPELKRELSERANLMIRRHITGNAEPDVGPDTPLYPDDLSEIDGFPPLPIRQYSQKAETVKNSTGGVDNGNPWGLLDKAPAEEINQHLIDTRPGGAKADADDLVIEEYDPKSSKKSEGSAASSISFDESKGKTITRRPINAADDKSITDDFVIEGFGPKTAHQSEGRSPSSVTLDESYKQTVAKPASNPSPRKSKSNSGLLKKEDFDSKAWNQYQKQLAEIEGEAQSSGRRITDRMHKIESDPKLEPSTKSSTVEKLQRELKDVENTLKKEKEVAESLLYIASSQYKLEEEFAPKIAEAQKIKKQIKEDQTIVPELREKLVKEQDEKIQELQKRFQEKIESNSTELLPRMDTRSAALDHIVGTDEIESFSQTAIENSPEEIEEGIRKILSKKEFQGTPTEEISRNILNWIEEQKMQGKEINPRDLAVVQNEAPKKIIAEKMQKKLETNQDAILFKELPEEFKALNQDLDHVNRFLIAYLKREAGIGELTVEQNRLLGKLRRTDIEDVLEAIDEPRYKIKEFMEIYPKVVAGEGTLPGRLHPTFERYQATSPLFEIRKKAFDLLLRRVKDHLDLSPHNGLFRLKKELTTSRAVKDMPLIEQVTQIRALSEKIDNMKKVAASEGRALNAQELGSIVEQKKQITMFQEDLDKKLAKLDRVNPDGSKNYDQRLAFAYREVIAVKDARGNKIMVAKVNPELDRGIIRAHEYEGPNRIQVKRRILEQTLLDHDPELRQLRAQLPPGPLPEDVSRALNSKIKQGTDLTRAKEILDEKVRKLMESNITGSESNTAIPVEGARQQLTKGDSSPARPDNKSKKRTFNNTIFRPAYGLDPNFEDVSVISDKLDEIEKLREELEASYLKPKAKGLDKIQQEYALLAMEEKIQDELESVVGNYLDKQKIPSENDLQQISHALDDAENEGLAQAKTVFYRKHLVKINEQITNKKGVAPADLEERMRSLHDLMLDHQIENRVRKTILHHEESFTKGLPVKAIEDDINLGQALQIRKNRLNKLQNDFNEMMVNKNAIAYSSHLSSQIQDLKKLYQHMAIRTIFHDHINYEVQSVVQGLEELITHEQSINDVKKIKTIAQKIASLIQDETKSGAEVIGKIEELEGNLKDSLKFFMVKIKKDQERLALYYKQDPSFKNRFDLIYSEALNARANDTTTRLNRIVESSKRNQKGLAFSFKTEAELKGAAGHYVQDEHLWAVGGKEAEVLLNPATRDELLAGKKAFPAVAGHEVRHAKVMTNDLLDGKENIYLGNVVSLDTNKTIGEKSIDPLYDQYADFSEMPAYQQSIAIQLGQYKAQVRHALGVERLSTLLTQPKAAEKLEELIKNGDITLKKSLKLRPDMSNAEAFSMVKAAIKNGELSIHPSGTLTGELFDDDNLFAALTGLRENKKLEEFLVKHDLKDRDHLAHYSTVVQKIHQIHETPLKQAIENLEKYITDPSLRFEVKMIPNSDNTYQREVVFASIDVNGSRVSAPLFPHDLQLHHQKEMERLSKQIPSIENYIQEIEFALKNAVGEEKEEFLKKVESSKKQLQSTREKLTQVKSLIEQDKKNGKTTNQLLLDLPRIKETFRLGNVPPELQEEVVGHFRDRLMSMQAASNAYVKSLKPVDTYIGWKFLPERLRAASKVSLSPSNFLLTGKPVSIKKKVPIGRLIAFKENTATKYTGKDLAQLATDQPTFKTASIKKSHAMETYEAEHPEVKLKYLDTTQIKSEDLPYTAQIRPVTKIVDKKNAPEIDIELQETVFYSPDYPGSHGLVRLGKTKTGEPVAVKTFYASDKIQKMRGGFDQDSINKKIIEEYESALYLDRLGVGPRVHGLHRDPTGRLHLVTDIVPGGFEDTPINSDTFNDLETILARLQGSRLTDLRDFQLYRTPEGRLLAIDAADLIRAVADPKKPFKMTDDFLRQANYHRLTLMEEALDQDHYNRVSTYLDLLNTSEPRSFALLSKDPRLAQIRKKLKEASGEIDADVKLKSRATGSAALSPDLSIYAHGPAAVSDHPLKQHNPRFSKDPVGYLKEKERKYPELIARLKRSGQNETLAEAEKYFAETQALRRRLEATNIEEAQILLNFIEHDRRLNRSLREEISSAFSEGITKYLAGHQAILLEQNAEVISKYLTYSPERYLHSLKNLTDPKNRMGRSLFQFHFQDQKALRDILATQNALAQEFAEYPSIIDHVKTQIGRYLQDRLRNEGTNIFHLADSIDKKMAGVRVRGDEFMRLKIGAWSYDSSHKNIHLGSEAINYVMERSPLPSEFAHEIHRAKIMHSDLVKGKDNSLGASLTTLSGRQQLAERSYPIAYNEEMHLSELSAMQKSIANERSHLLQKTKEALLKKGLAKADSGPNQILKIVKRLEKKGKLVEALGDAADEIEAIQQRLLHYHHYAYSMGDIGQTSMKDFLSYVKHTSEAELQGKLSIKMITYGGVNPESGMDIDGQHLLITMAVTRNGRELTVPVFNSPSAERNEILARFKKYEIEGSPNVVIDVPQQQLPKKMQQNLKLALVNSIEELEEYSRNLKLNAQGFLAKNSPGLAENLEDAHKISIKKNYYEGKTLPDPHIPYTNQGVPPKLGGQGPILAHQIDLDTHRPFIIPFSEEIVEKYSSYLEFHPHYANLRLAFFHSKLASEELLDLIEQERKLTDQLDELMASTENEKYIDPVKKKLVQVKKMIQLETKKFQQKALNYKDDVIQDKAGMHFLKATPLSPTTINFIHTVEEPLDTCSFAIVAAERQGVFKDIISNPDLLMHSGDSFFAKVGDEPFHSEVYRMSSDLDGMIKVPKDYVTGLRHHLRTAANAVFPKKYVFIDLTSFSVQEIKDLRKAMAEFLTPEELARIIEGRAPSNLFELDLYRGPKKFQRGH